MYPDIGTPDIGHGTRYHWHWYRDIMSLTHDIGTLAPDIVYPFWSLISLGPASAIVNSCIVFANEDSFEQLICKKDLASRRQTMMALEKRCLGSEDLKSVGAPLPLEQKHTVWIRTGNLSLIKRNALTIEPRMRIWHVEMWIIAIIKSNYKKKFITRKTCWIAVWLLANSGAESHNEDRTWQL